MESGKHESATSLDKVGVAYRLSQLMEEATLDLGNMEGDTAKYLVDAINHVC